MQSCVATISLWRSKRPCKSRDLLLILKMDSEGSKDVVSNQDYAYQHEIDMQAQSSRKQQQID